MDIPQFVYPWISGMNKSAEHIQVKTLANIYFYVFWENAQ